MLHGIYPICKILRLLVMILLLVAVLVLATVRSLLKKGHGSLTNLFYDEVYEDDHQGVNVGGGTTTTSTKNATWNTADLGTTNALTTTTTTRDVIVGSLRFI